MGSIHYRWSDNNQESSILDTSELQMLLISRLKHLATPAILTFIGRLEALLTLDSYLEKVILKPYLSTFTNLSEKL